MNRIGWIRRLRYPQLSGSSSVDIRPFCARIKGSSDLGKMEKTSLTPSDEALRSGLLDVLNACPANQCNPNDCPLYYLRGMNHARRLQWLNALDRSDLEYLAVYHYTCMKIKLQDAELEPTPARSRRWDDLDCPTETTE